MLKGFLRGAFLGAVLMIVLLMVRGGPSAGSLTFQAAYVFGYIATGVVVFGAIGFLLGAIFGRRKARIDG